jgi:putative FmdB family regulatory protein
MPLYEFECRACGHRFEALVRDSSLPSCPGCQGHNLERLLSMFAVSSAHTRRSNLEAARRRNAKTQRDKQIAEREQAHHHHHDH